jgi:ABC-type transport system involved in multi-copper enzyme maturation permease subunit
MQEPSWRSGFANLFAKENHAWWGTRRWLVQAILWTLIVNGITAVVLFALPAMLQMSGEPGEAESFDAVAQSVGALFQIGTVALALGAILLAQDRILGERQSGATEWILSKPVSRAAYFLSKLAADAIGVLIILVGLQSAIAYGLVSLANGGPYPLAPFSVAAGGLALHTLFYLALTLMMGVLTDSRGKLLGVALGTLFGGLLVASFLGTYSLFMPWSMTTILPAAALQVPLPLPIWLPLATTAALTLLCIAVALWKFKHLES